MAPDADYATSGGRVTEVEEFKMKVLWMIRDYPKVSGFWESWKSRECCELLAHCIEKMGPGGTYNG